MERLTGSRRGGVGAKMLHEWERQTVFYKDMERCINTAFFLNRKEVTDGQASITSMKRFCFFCLFVFCFLKLELGGTTVLPFIKGPLWRIGPLEVLFY